MSESIIASKIVNIVAAKTDLASFTAARNQVKALKKEFQDLNKASGVGSARLGAKGALGDMIQLKSQFAEIKKVNKQTLQDKKDFFTVEKSLRKNSLADNARQDAQELARVKSVAAQQNALRKQAVNQLTQMPSGQKWNKSMFMSAADLPFVGPPVDRARLTQAAEAQKELNKAHAEALKINKQFDSIGLRQGNANQSRNLTSQLVQGGYNNAVSKYAPRISGADMAGFQLRKETLTKEFESGAMNASIYRMHMQQLNGEMGRTARNFRTVGQEMRSVRSAIIAGTAAWTGFSAIMAVTRVGAQMENTRSLMKSIFGDQMQSQMEYLKKTTQELGVSFLDSTENFAKFSFSAKTAGMETKDINDAFKNFSVAGIMMGSSTDQINHAFLALEQMMSSGKVRAQELNIQLVNAIPGAVEMGAKAMGLSVAQLRDKMKKGEVDAKEFVTKLGKLYYSTFEKDLPSALQNFDRVTARTKNQLTQLLDSAWINGVKDGMTDLMNMASELMEGPLGGFIDTLSTGFGWVAFGFTATIRLINLGMKELLNLFGIGSEKASQTTKDIWGLIAGFLMMRSTLKLLSWPFGLLVKWLSIDLLGWLPKVRNAVFGLAMMFRTLGIAEMFAAWPAWAIVAAVTAIGVAGYELIKHWEPVKKFFTDTFDWINQKALALSGTLKGLIPDWMKESATVTAISKGADPTKVMSAYATGNYGNVAGTQPTPLKVDVKVENNMTTTTVTSPDGTQKITRTMNKQ